MSTRMGSSQSIGRVEATSSLSEALKQAEDQCKDCKTSSPMVCVERCDIWRVKNEIVSLRQLTAEKDHSQKLLNAVKNPRRVKILDALCEQPRSLKELQRYLKREGFYHSASTIRAAYVKPLINAGLVREDASRYKVSLYGRNVQGLLHNTALDMALPVHSCCYEEIVIRELVKKPKTFDELAMSVPQKSLSRVMKRLQNRLLLSNGLRGEYVFYHKAKSKPRQTLSPTEKRVFESIPIEGISARRLSLQAKITVRRTYKYLRRLKEKNLIYEEKRPRTYELTAKGSKVAALLYEISTLSASSLNASIPMFIPKVQHIR